MDLKCTALYESLGILPTATDDEIKRAYRKLALSHHPDKNRAADRDAFQFATRAYGILSDPKKRAVYDGYGEIGVNMLGTVGGAFLDPDARDMVCCLFIALAILVVLALLFLLAIVLRIDGIVTWTWPVVFTPVWVVLVGMFVLVVAEITVFHPANDDEVEETLEGIAAEDRPVVRAARQAEKARCRRMHCTYSVLYFLLFLSVAILVVALLDRLPGMSLLAALSPYFVLEALTGLGKTAAAVQELRKGSATWLEDFSGLTAEEARPLTTPKMFGVIFDHFWWWIIRVSFAALLALRSDGFIDIKWRFVFLPLYFVFLWHLWKIFAIYHRIRAVSSPEARRQGGQFLAISLFFVAVAGAVFATAVGLVVRRLEAPPRLHQPATLIAVPIFTILVLPLVFTGFCLALLYLYGKRPQKQDVEVGATTRGSR